jgi:hypothetical protein
MQLLPAIMTTVWILLAQQIDRFQREQAAIVELTRLGVCVVLALPEKAPDEDVFRFVWMVNPHGVRQQSRGIGRIEFHPLNRLDPAKPMSRLEVLFGMEPDNGSGDPSDASQLTDATLEHVANFTQCCFLDLNRVEISDEGLRHLRSLSCLHYLDLSNTKITDAGLVHLERLHHLQWLVLNGTEVSDAGLARLTSLHSLQSLQVHGTHVTQEGVDSVRKAIPTLNVLSDFEMPESDSADDLLDGVLGAPDNNQRVNAKNPVVSHRSSGNRTNGGQCRFMRRLSTKGRSYRYR